LVSFEQDIASLDRVINGVTNEDGEVVEKGLTDHIADHASAIGDLTETTNELVDLVNGLKTTQEELVGTVQTLGTTVG
jgi:ABC-type transporter Mla subunit MlaD